MSKKAANRNSTNINTGELRDVYEWLENAPKLRDAFLFAVCGPSSRTYSEKEKKAALASYSRDDVAMAYELGFC